MTGSEAPRELVLASAGSGKTFRISSRLIGLLAAGVPAERVLASSFTRKAAGQILDRVLERMAAAALDPGRARELGQYATLDPGRPAPSDPDGWAEILARVARDLNRLNVSTLDAFMVGAASSFETELGLPTGWRIADEAETRRLVSRAVAKVLESGERGRLLRNLRAVGRGTPGRSVHDRLVRFVREWLDVDETLAREGPDPWGAFRRAGVAARPTPAEAAELARSVEELLLQSGMAIGKSMTTAVGNLAQQILAGEWVKLLGSTLVKNCALPAPTFSRQAIPADLVEAILGVVVPAARAALRADLADRVEAVGDLARAFRDEFRALQAETGAYRFGDITRLVGSGSNDSVGGRADFYYRLDGRIQHILLDEFQDTSIAQWEALEPLLDEVLSDDGRAAVIVADPKQSIYAWRGAEPGLVHAVGDRYSLEADRLAVSFRSSQKVLDFVNQVFRGIAGNPLLHDGAGREAVAANWAKDFDEHRAHHDLPGYGTLEYGPEDEDSSRPLLLKYAAERVVQLRAEAPGFSIGVLTRTNQTVARLYLELKKLGVPVSMHGGNPLTDSVACESLLALLRLADHPGDMISAYLVAESPLGPVTGFTAWNDPLARARFSTAIRYRLLDEGYGPVIGQLAMKLAPSCDAREARRLSQLVDLAHRHDVSPSLRPADFVRIAEAERVEDPSTANVKVMTVHQAKGLEFDIVVLPELSRKIESNSRREVLPLRLDETRPDVAESGLVGPERTATRRPEAVMPGGGEAIRAHFPEMERAWLQDRMSLWRDELSGLYVAMTRARYATYAIVAPSAAAAESRKVTAAALIATSLGITLDPAPATGTRAFSVGSPEWFLDPAARPETTEDATPAPPAGVRARIDWGARARRRISPSELHRRESTDIRNLLRLDAAVSMERGTLVHAWFERIGWIEDGVPSDDELREIAARVAPGFPDDGVNVAISDFRRWTTGGGPIAAALRRPAGRFTAEVELEVPFMERRDGGLMEGVIDRLVVIRENGRVVAAEVLDYKTGTPEDSVIADRVDEYRPQLEAYRRAVATMFGIPADRCARTLLFVDLERVIRLDGENTSGIVPPPAAPT